MNKSGNENRSVRNTKRKLRESLMELMMTKPIEQITAKELCEMADINRGTFYFHYSDVYDLLEQIEDGFFVELEKINESFRDIDNGEEFILSIVDFIGENDDFCRLMLSNYGDMKFVSRVIVLIKNICTSFWLMIAPNAPYEKMEYYSAFMVNGFVGIMKKWLDEGKPIPPEEISRLAVSVISNTVEHCIK